MTMPTPPAPDAGQPAAPAAPAPAPQPQAPTSPPAPAPQNQPPTPAPPTWTPPPAIPSPPPTAQQLPGDDGSRDVTRLPQWAQKEISDQRAENARRRVSERTAVVSMHAFAAASALGINSQALFDSSAFAAMAADLDPHAADFNDQLRTKLGAILQSNPWLAAAQPPPPPPPPAPAVSGGEFTGSPGEGAPITEEQLANMTPDQITKAFEAGKLKHLM